MFVMFESLCVVLKVGVYVFKRFNEKVCKENNGKTKSINIKNLFVFIFFLKL